MRDKKNLIISLCLRQNQTRPEKQMTRTTRETILSKLSKILLMRIKLKVLLKLSTGRLLFRKIRAERL